MEIKKVVVVGTGTMGGQIGFQCAVSGFQTVMCDINEASLDGCRSSHRRFAEVFVAKRGSSQEVVDAAVARLSYTDDLAEACRDADLVSESVPEDPEIKRAVYAQLNRCCPDHTILTTNTSTLLPSQFAESTGRPDRFLALHFANPVWDANIGEVMPHPGTDPEVFERVLEFVAEIGMVPIRLEKEQNGYIINSLLMPLLIAAQGLITNDVATHEDVRQDLDDVDEDAGRTLRHHGSDRSRDDPQRRPVLGGDRWGRGTPQESPISSKSGLSTVEDSASRPVKGYYSYPRPAFAQEGFLG